MNATHCNETRGPTQMASRIAFAVAVALGMLALVAAIPSNKVITAFNNAAQVRACTHQGLSFCGTGRGLQARAHRMQELRYALRPPAGLVLLMQAPRVAQRTPGKTNPSDFPCVGRREDLGNPEPDLRQGELPSGGAEPGRGGAIIQGLLGPSSRGLLGPRRLSTGSSNRPADLTAPPIMSACSSTQRRTWLSSWPCRTPRPSPTPSRPPPQVCAAAARWGPARDLGHNRGRGAHVATCGLGHPGRPRRTAAGSSPLEGAPWPPPPAPPPPAPRSLRRAHCAQPVGSLPVCQPRQGAQALPGRPLCGPAGGRQGHRAGHRAGGLPVQVGACFVFSFWWARSACVGRACELGR